MLVVKSQTSDDNIVIISIMALKKKEQFSYRLFFSPFFLEELDRTQRFKWIKTKIIPVPKV